MDVLGLIPARGGSKGIPRKNLAPLAGRPLLAWTCEAALTATSLTRVVVSTDDDEIAAEARRNGVEAPFRRPRELARDDTPMVDVVGHALGTVGDPGAVVLLQPTSPLRRAAHIDGAVELWLSTGAETVVSVVAVPHNFTPASLMRLEGDRVRPLGDGWGPLDRGQKETLYARNGPAVLVTRPDVVRGGSLYGEDVRAYVMSAADSVDVDGPEELALAELYLSSRPR
jgi:CMP-N,N'-diacetyllegionaminic acid synthase